MTDHRDRRGRRAALILLLPFLICIAALATLLIPLGANDDEETPRAKRGKSAK